MYVTALGFAPGGFVQFHTTSAGSPSPRTLTSGQLDGIGTFGQLVTPPSFSNFKSNRETFNLIASDTRDPAAPLAAFTQFEVVRFGLTTVPAQAKPSSRVRYTARGFVPGKRIYAHYRFGGKTRRTVSLGVAKGACGIATKRMRLLPTRARLGTWKTYVDQAKRFSVNSRPQWKGTLYIRRTFG
jgi:hypothetical protein